MPTRSLLWRGLDRAAHLAYCPTLLGRGCARARWHHKIHLIPGPLLEWICVRGQQAHEQARPSVR